MCQSNRGTGPWQRASESEEGGSWLWIVCLLHPPIAAVEDKAVRLAAEGRGWRRSQGISRGAALPPWWWRGCSVAVAIFAVLVSQIGAELHRTRQGFLLCGPHRLESCQPRFVCNYFLFSATFVLHRFLLLVESLFCTHFLFPRTCLCTVDLENA